MFLKRKYKEKIKKTGTTLKKLNCYFLKKKRNDSLARAPGLCYAPNRDVMRSPTKGIIV